MKVGVEENKKSDLLGKQAVKTSAVWEMGKFIGSEVSEYEIETVAFQIMQWKEY